MAETRAGAAAITEPDCCGSLPRLTAGMEGSHEASVAPRRPRSPRRGHCWGAFVGPFALQDGGALAVGHLGGTLTPRDGGAVPVGQLWGLSNDGASAVRHSRCLLNGGTSAMSHSWGLSHPQVAVL